MNEDIEITGGVTEPATTDADSDYKSILSGEGVEPESSTPAEESEELTKPPEPQTDDQGEQQEETDEEVTLEIGGKQFTMKQSEAINLLENASKMADREKALNEKETSLNRDYTQKTQALAGIRKSFESNFGRIPQDQEIQALGKVWKAYFENPVAKDVLDQIILGTYQGGQVAPTTNGQPQDAYTRQLQMQIAQLNNRFEHFLSSSEEKESAKTQAEAMNHWKSWVDSKAQQNIKITEEVDAKMAPFVAAIRQAHPDWESTRVLDEAYKHATIDDIQKNTVKKVLTTADEAKKRGSIKITPKTPKKAESEMGYRDIVMGAASR